jgi:hypothetical protein
MVSIFDLNEIILPEVLFKWIGITDIGHVDSALCSRDARTVWLSLVKSNGPTTFLNKLLSNEKQGKFILWCMNRQMTRIGSAVLQGFPDLSIQMIVQFLRSICSHLTKVDFSAKYASISLLSLAGRYCSGLLDVKVSNCSDDKALMIFLHDVSAILQL